MVRWISLLFVLCCLLAPALALEIADLPAVTDAEFDLTWDLTVSRRAPAVSLDFLTPAKSGYRLSITATAASWQPAGKSASASPVRAILSLTENRTYAVTAKVRRDTFALLIDHRLVLCAPAPGAFASVIVPAKLPGGVTIASARYHRVEPHLFGDDFMRPEAPKPDGRTWIEDPSWQVAYFRKDYPGKDPTDPKTKTGLLNPWALSLFYNSKTSTNGFWYSYTGVGPSWVVANSTMVSPSWDRYYVEAAVYPEYDSAVGLIAAYQDNSNYLLFRWKARDFVGKYTGTHAQLVAVVDGRERILAESPRGFDPGQWYRLRLNLGWQRIEALVDGEPLLSAANPGPAEGRIGLFAQGVGAPRKPKLDEATATMYVATDTETGRTVNDAADALSKTSNILFDDVRTGDWVGIDALAASPYWKEQTGKWTRYGSVMQADSAGKIVTGSPAWNRYAVSARVRLQPSGSGGILLHLNGSTGYLWSFSTREQRLQPIAGAGAAVAGDRAATGLPAASWVNLRAETDGPYLACFVNGQRVLDVYNPAATSGRCGLMAAGRGVQFDAVAVTPSDATLDRVKVHKGFEADAWMVTWSGAEADWYPEVNHGRYVALRTVTGRPPDPGPAAPLMTSVPGLYWNKGGYYHNLRVIIPVAPASVNGQELYLTTHYDRKAGYRLQLTRENGKGLATLFTPAGKAGAYPFTLGDHSQLVFDRRGSLLLLSAQEIDPEDESSEPEVVKEERLFVYRNTLPQQLEMIGFTVTEPSLPAAQVVVASDRIQDAFDQSPVTWVSQSGIWAVMARYSCQPQWNWYGGFGTGTPTVWNKIRLDGDQNVEVYLGIKMQYDRMTENEAARFRDMNVSICADGAHVNSGYTLIRAGRQGTQAITLLLRKGIIVKSSTAPTDLIPPGGHRQWFATRMEKRGREIRVYLDNHLAMTYEDPDPIPGGYTAIWTLNNGLMIGRANLSAEKMTPGMPLAAAPLVVQEELPPLPSPTVTVNGQPCALATFESGFDGWQPRPGLTGALDRERITGANGKVNTYLRIVNTYPAGDLSATVTSTPVDLAAKPIFTCDYWFDKGAQVNLYLRWQNVWYEILMTGQEASENVKTAGRLAMQADGEKHHIEADLGKMLTAAIREKTGVEPPNLVIQEAVVADWSAPGDLRRYGFGVNPGGTVLRFDNVGFLPRAQ